MDPGYKLLAAKYLRKQAKQLREQFEGVRAADDIEYVHQARVASRRVRAALKVFGECFEPKKLNRWTKAIRRITTELGDARDKDVQIEYVRAGLRTLGDPDCFPGLARLLVHFEYIREEMQLYVVKAINRLRQGGELKSLEKACKKIQDRAASNHIDVHSRYSFARAEFHIAGRLEELLACEECLSRPDDAPAHHVMRIAAKRLRYTLEITRPIYDGQLDTVLTVTKQIQTLLGDVHDCDIWQDQLDEFAAEEHDRLCSLFGHGGLFSRLDRGLQYLREDRRRRREQAFAELLELWRETKSQGLWDELSLAVRTRRKTKKPTNTAPAAVLSESSAPGETGTVASKSSPAMVVKMQEAGVSEKLGARSGANGNGSHGEFAAEKGPNHTTQIGPPEKDRLKHHRKKTAVS